MPNNRPSLLSNTKNRNSTLQGTLYKCTSIAQYGKELADSRKSANLQTESTRPLIVVRSSYQGNQGPFVHSVETNSILPTTYLVSPAVQAPYQAIPEQPDILTEKRRKISTPQAKIESISALPPAVQIRVLKNSLEESDHRMYLSQIKKLNGKRQLSNPLAFPNERNNLELCIQRVSIQHRSARREKLPSVPPPKSKYTVVEKPMDRLPAVDTIKEADEQREFENKTEGTSDQQDKNSMKIDLILGKEEKKQQQVMTPARNKRTDVRRTPEKNRIRQTDSSNRPSGVVLQTKKEFKKEVKKGSSGGLRARYERTGKGNNDLKTPLNNSMNADTKSKAFTGMTNEQGIEKENQKESTPTAISGTDLTQNNNNQDPAATVENQNTTFVPGTITKSETVKPKKKKKKQQQQQISPPKPKPIKEEVQQPALVPKPRPVFAAPDFYTVFFIIFA